MAKNILFALVAALTLAACETMEGAGQDISTAGDALTNEAQETQSGLLTVETRSGRPSLPCRPRRLQAASASNRPSA